MKLRTGSLDWLDPAHGSIHRRRLRPVEGSRIAMVKDRVIVRDAIDLLKKRGWVSGELGNDSRGYCLMGALTTAAFDYASDSNIIFRRLPLLAIAVTSSLCEVEHADLSDDVVKFNDERCSDQNEAIEFLETVLKRLEKLDIYDH